MVGKNFWSLEQWSCPSVNQRITLPPLKVLWNLWMTPKIPSVVDILEKEMIARYSYFLPFGTWPV